MPCTLQVERGDDANFDLIDFHFIEVKHKVIGFHKKLSSSLIISLN